MPDSEENVTRPRVTAFARQSTGLVKNVSLIDSISLNLSNMSIGPLLTTIAGSTAATLLLVPSVTGLNLVAASMIAFLLSIPQIVVYTMMTRRYPRTGGDYIWVSRSFGGMIGSTLSFFGYTCETLAFLALVAVLTDFAIGGVGLTMNGVYSAPTSAWGDLFNSPYTLTNAGWQFIVGAIPFAAVILLNIWKPKAGYRLVTVLTLFGIFTLLLCMGILLAAGQSGIKSYIDSTASFVTGGANETYANVAASYVSSGKPFDIDLGAVFTIMPVMFAFVYPWLNAAPAVGSELRGKKTVNWNVPISAVVAFVLLTSTLGVLYGVAGMPFINGAFHNNFWQGLGLNFFTLAMGVVNNVYVAWIIGIGWILMQFGVIAYGVIVFSRYLLAQSFDRFLPSRLSYVSPTYSSPVIAHTVDLIIAVALIALATFFFGTFSALFGAILASMIYFIFIGLSALKQALTKERGGSQIGLALAGILDAGVFGFITYLFITSSKVAGFTYNYLNVGYLVGTLVAGAVIFLVSRQYHKTRGIDISLNYKEIPPE
jgi:amino acid transporter